ncbi:hypothetical protein [Limnochorda pilosa]|uniref:Uncharacterized protein n=1 Tax=Limnochorda pilosa TaxID=1555112 RepID=A0A0K2SH54_LIMPI|nr:hypothetical protein [Limnochorda pilosa]BAS26451.1 hypothetical protein LIP_0594 [Limnochorda pilosa]
MLGVGVLMLCIAAADAPGLFREGRWRELGAFLLVWGVASALALLQASQVELPVPAVVIVDLVRKLVGSGAAH